MTLDELRERARGNADALWWTLRFLDEVTELTLSDGTATPDDTAFAVDCFLRLAVYDPEWATKALTQRGPGAHKLATLLSGERLIPALSRLNLPSTKEDAMLRARILCDSATWQRDEGRARDIWLEAWGELVRAPDADYPCYRALATERLASLTDTFWRSQFLPKALAVTARHRDWSTFNTWLEAWQSLPEPMRQGHAACAQS